MLTEEEIQEILEEVKNYPYAGVACLDALKIVQAHHGWVTDDAVKDIAALLDISPEKVDGVATFYTRIYRQPVGRHVILVCDSISCMVMGYETVYNYISVKLGIIFGETTADKRFTLLPITCIGNCDQAPAIMIDNELFDRVNIENIDQLLENYA